MIIVKSKGLKSIGESVKKVQTELAWAYWMNKTKTAVRVLPVSRKES